MLAILFLAASSVYSQGMMHGLGEESELPFVYLESNDFPIFANSDPRIFFIDFESISSKVEEVAILDEKGEEVWTKNVFALPANSIFEMGLHGLEPGRYEVELRVINRTLRTTLRL